MSEERTRIEIGFDGGQIMGAVVTGPAADELERAVAERIEGALTLDTEDGRYSVAVHRIVYLKRFARDSRVGFGG